MSKKRLILISVFGIFIIVSLLVYFGQRQNRQRETYYSGTIETTQSQLAFQTSGRVAFVHVREGNAVVANQLLAELDTAEWTARNDQAKAALAKAENNTKQLEIMLKFYRQSLPAEVTRAEANLKSLTNTLSDAEKNNSRYTQLFQRGVVAEKERDAVKLKYDNAKASLKEGQAALQQALSGMKKIDATQMELLAARSQAEAARAVLEQTMIQSGYTALKAPFAGIITSRNVEPGEVVTAGREVLTLSDLATVDLKIFVSETEIGKVKPGQPVDVKVDTFPDRIFKGKVSFISPEGEFTPKIIQTFKERVKLVYLVKVTIPNPGYLLKPGMPADAWLR
jgi:HlyD family secretion protein